MLDDYKYLLIILILFPRNMTFFSCVVLYDVILGVTTRGIQRNSGAIIVKKKDIFLPANLFFLPRTWPSLINKEKGIDRFVQLFRMYCER